MDSAIKNEYEQLLSAIQNRKDRQLDKNKTEIKFTCRRNNQKIQYQEGLYQYYLKIVLKFKSQLHYLKQHQQYLKLLNQ
jgi:hypothetical protein